MGNSLPQEIAEQIEDYQDWFYTEVVYDKLIKYNANPESFILIYAPNYAFIVEIIDKEDSYSGSMKVTHKFDLNDYKDSNIKQIFLGTNDVWKEKFGISQTEYMEKELK